MTERVISDGSVDLAGRVALVTGTTSGFGERFAKVLAHVGAKVVLTGRRVDRLGTLKDQLESEGHEVLAVALDVTEEASITECVSEAVSHFGKIDILVNNAGMNVEGRAVELTAEEVDRVFDTNLRSVYLMSREVAKDMIKRDGGGGRIINIASMGAYKVLPGLSAYCASKAGVVSLTKAMAREWARYDLTVNALCPGYIETELNTEWFQSELGQAQVKSFPKRRLGALADLDRPLLILSAADSHFINGASLEIDDLQGL